MTNELLYLGAGVLLMLVLYEYQPKLAGWLLIVLVLGFLVYNRRKVGL